MASVVLCVFEKPIGLDRIHVTLVYYPHRWYLKKEVGVKKICLMFVALLLLISAFVTPGVYARDITDAIFGKDSLVSVPFKIVGDAAGRGWKFFNSMLGGDYYRDYGDTGYRHGGYAYEYDYGNYGDGANGYGYNHQGLDGNQYSGV